MTVRNRKMMIMEGKGGEYTGRVARIIEEGVKEREREREREREFLKTMEFVISL
jgi:hypothetical protein